MNTDSKEYLPLNNVAFFDLNDEFIFGWHTYVIPPFQVGQTIWLEKSVYPAWKQDPPEELKHDAFEIVNISHSLQQIYSNNIMTTYSMEVTIKKRKDDYDY